MALWYRGLPAEVKQRAAEPSVSQNRSWRQRADPGLIKFFGSVRRAAAEVVPSAFSAAQRAEPRAAVIQGERKARMAASRAATPPDHFFQQCLISYPDSTKVLGIVRACPIRKFEHARFGAEMKLYV